MFPGAMSNSTFLSEEVPNLSGMNHVVSTTSPEQSELIKKKRNLPGNPDPDAEVIALSPKTLLATNIFECEICNKGFQRHQNLQLHRRGHNLPWKLNQRKSKLGVKKRAYVCPEPACIHHNPSRALGDLTGIKKHYCRKHGEKKWKCDRCSKFYAVQSDCRAHSKSCGTREYRCDCGTLFARKDSFLNHRAFCDALAEESARLTANQLHTPNPLFHSLFVPPIQDNFQNQIFINPWDPSQQNPNPSDTTLQIKTEDQSLQIPILSSSSFLQEPHLSPFHVPTKPSSNAALSATALLQKAATVSRTAIGGPGHVTQLGVGEFGSASQIDSGSHDSMRGLMTRNLKSERLTRDFLGLAGDAGGDGGNGGAVDVNVNGMDKLTFTGGLDLEYQPYDHSLVKSQECFGFAGITTGPETGGIVETNRKYFQKMEVIKMGKPNFALV